MKFDFLNSRMNSGRAFTVNCLFLVTLISLAFIFSEMNIGKSAGSSVLAIYVALRLLLYLSFTKRVYLGICFAWIMANNRQSLFFFLHNPGFILLLGFQDRGTLIILTLCATQKSLPSCLHLWLHTDNDNLLLSGEEEHIVLSGQQSVNFIFEPCFCAELVRCESVFIVFHYCFINDYFRVFYMLLHESALVNAFLKLLRMVQERKFDFMEFNLFDGELPRRYIQRIFSNSNN